MIRRAAALTVVLAFALPGVAVAGPILDRAVRCLERQPVCVDPAARNLLSAAEARRLAKQIESDVSRGGDFGGGGGGDF